MDRPGRRGRGVHGPRLGLRTIRGRRRPRRRGEALRAHRARNVHRQPGRSVPHRARGRPRHLATGLTGRVAPGRAGGPRRSPDRPGVLVRAGPRLHRSGRVEPRVLVVRGHLRPWTTAAERHQRRRAGVCGRGDRLLGSRQGDRARGGGLRRRHRPHRGDQRPVEIDTRVPGPVRAVGRPVDGHLRHPAPARGDGAFQGGTRQGWRSPPLHRCHPPPDTGGAWPRWCRSRSQWAS